ncbi:DUF6075 family protein [Ruminiclostridium cellobioparum]|uniref:DUF6075 family protein n=1 Tax=Ruminiclostridium cellobioparum TaxID=29355 RepID=UPI0035E40C21
MYVSGWPRFRSAVHLSYEKGNLNGGNSICKKEHKGFYSQMLIKIHNDGSYHRALFYAMGVRKQG